MKYLTIILACGIMSACTTVNVYPSNDPVVIIHKSGARNMDNPYDRRRDY